MAWPGGSGTPTTRTHRVDQTRRDRRTAVPDLTDPRLEARRRRRPARHGLVLRKSRSRSGWTVDDHGGYMIIDPYRNSIELGERFDLDLDDVEQFVAD